MVFIIGHGLSLAAASGGYSLVTLHGLFTAMTSLVAKHGLQSSGTGVVASGFSCPLDLVAPGVQVPHGMRKIPGPGVEHVSPALADEFLTTGPPRKPSISLLCNTYYGSRRASGYLCVHQRELPRGKSQCKNLGVAQFHVQSFKQAGLQARALAKRVECGRSTVTSLSKGPTFQIPGATPLPGLKMGI